MLRSFALHTNKRQVFGFLIFKYELYSWSEKQNRCLERGKANLKSYAYSKWNMKLNSSQWRYFWQSGCQSLLVQTPHCGNMVTTTLQKSGAPGKDDVYHVNPITKIKVRFFHGSQYMSDLIPIKLCGNEFKMNMS